MTITNTAHTTGLFPLSSSQSRIWFMEQLDKSITAYNIPLDYKITGKLRTDLLERSILTIIQRHESLRTTFIDVDGMPFQKVNETANFDLEVIHLETEDEVNKKELVRRHSLDHGNFKFNINKGPLYHFRLLITGSEEYLLLVNFHHLICDAYSVGIFIDEMTRVYQMLATESKIDLPPVMYNYSDYALWEKEWLTGEGYNKQLEYWKNELSGIPDVLKLPLDFHRPKIQSYNGSEYHFHIDPATREKLSQLSQRNGSTLFLTLLAAYGSLLSRYSLQDDLVIGVPIANRTRFETESLVGILINSLPIRFRMKEDTTFREVIRMTRDKFLSAFENQELPFEKLVEEMKVKRNMSSPPVFQTLFNYLTVYRKEIDVAGLSMRMIDAERDTAQIDLTFTIHDHDNKLDCFLEFNTDLFSETTIARLAGHYLSFLQQAPTMEDLPVRAINFLTKGEKDLMLRQWNRNEVEYPEGFCTHHIFEDQVRKTPEAVALEFEDEELTYAELNARANNLAHYLVRKGAKEDTFVAICLERSIDLIIGMLAIAKTGATCLPLDPIYPKPRLSLIVDDAQPVLFLTQKSLLGVIPETQAELILMDNKSEYDDESVENLHLGNPEKAAYILYTSGSTGKPKGVMVKHNSTINCINSITGKLRVTSADTLLAVSTVAFDVAEMDIYLPLMNGGKLVVASQETMHDIGLLKKRLISSGATLMMATPVMFKMLILSSWEGKSDLRILIGGEALSREMAGKLLDICGEVWNGYAPTETTIYSLVKKVTRESTTGDGYVELGRPLDNTILYVMNSHQVPLPVGIPGELYIGGAGVSVGYLNLPELNSARYVVDPLGLDPGVRFYKTGDLVQYQPDGTVAFLNRIDFQVKIRGFRIELGEIESIFSQVKGVKENVVIVKQDNSGEKMLVAYYLTEPGIVVSIKEIRQYLKEHLPEYMVPVAFVNMEKFPLTSTLKIDRNALPDPDLNAHGETNGYAGPHTATEHRLAKIWSSLLNLRKVGINDDFFEIGGNSMIAVALMVRIEKEMNVRLPLATLFERSTIHLMGRMIDHNADSVEWRSLVPIRTAGKKKPLFLVHGLGLNVLLYTTVVNFLDPDQPVYGLQAKGLNGLDDPLDTIDSIAAYYISEIQTIDKDGPYALAGFSLGGRIAYEMARQLEATGKKVSFLGIFDATAEGSVMNLPFFQRAGYRLNYFSNYVSWNIANFFNEPNKTKLTVIRRRWRGLEKRLRGMDVRFDKKDMVSMGKQKELPKYLRRVHRANRRANREYELRPYNGVVHLYKAEKQTFYIPEPDKYGWDRMALGGVVIHVIPGEHSSTFAPPNDKYFATVLQSSLNESCNN